MALVLLATLVAEPYPDAIDVLKTGGVKPRMNLLLDSSCSMRFSSSLTNCEWFADNYNGGNLTLTLNGQMRAVLVGCVEPGDGILDKWYDQVEFAIRDFRGLRAELGATVESMKSAVLGVPASGGTPLSRVQSQGGLYLNEKSTDGNSESCQSFFQLLLSDGDPNGGDGRMDQDCQGGEVFTANRRRPWEAAAYLNDRHPDVLCNMAGDQQIVTYTLGFGAPGWFNPVFLQNTADSGGGTYFHAATVPELIDAFDSIMATVTARSQTLASVSVGLDAFFTENRAYAGAFQPSLAGPWKGNLRRLCLFPPRDASGAYDSTTDTCLFRSPDGTDLYTNPSVVDLWTGLPVEGTTLGGAGEVLLQTLGSSPTAPFWGKRNLLTWRAGEAGWVPIHPDTWSETDAHLSGCDRYRLINFLHGYSWDADCSTGAPTSVRKWPMADVIHGNPIELRYGPCESPTGAMVPGRCYVVLPTNDGVLHIFDSATGRETSGLVPAELWRPGVIARSYLGELPSQPSIQYRHRYYLDGNMEFEHDDSDGNGVIDRGERARVIFGLGRGGRAQYVLDVASMSDGVIDSEVTIAPILPTASTEYARLLDAWSAPTLATMRIGDTVRSVAIFATGHEPQYDITERVESPTPDTHIQFPDSGGADEEVFSAKCKGKDGLAERNGYGQKGLCKDTLFKGCKGDTNKPCYDSAGVPLDQFTPPLSMDEGDRKTTAIRFQFKDFDLGPEDVLLLEDDQGQRVAEYRNQDLDRAWTAWVYAPGASFRLISNGVDSRNEGFEIDNVEYQLGSPFAAEAPGAQPAPVLGQDALPALLIADTDLLAESARAFADVSVDDTLALVVAKDCKTLGARCLDATEAPDLTNMVCSISGAPSPYVQDGRLEALYFGDECGQVFKVWTPDRGKNWSAKRLVNLNGGELDVSKDHRKLFRQVDIVESVCPGKEVVGLYFGTGNVQRPLARDELQRGSATNGADVVGVIWDHEDLPTDVTQAGLVDVRNVDAVDPQQIFAAGKHGWFLSLDQDERMLEDLLVFDGVVYFKTFQPLQDPDPCSAGSGTERLYAVDNCSGASTSEDQDRAARVVKSEVVTKTSPLVFVAPKNGEPMIVTTDISSSVKATVGREPRTRPGLFLWRELP